MSLLQAKAAAVLVALGCTSTSTTPTVSGFGVMVPVVLNKRAGATSFLPQQQQQLPLYGASTISSRATSQRKPPFTIMEASGDGEPKAKREPWEFRRFVKTLVFFQGPRRPRLPFSSKARAERRSRRSRRATKGAAGAEGGEGLPPFLAR
ncbi:unnamed protein product, partial [Ectocarpus sp. 4 AP-2014]